MSRRSCSAATRRRPCPSWVAATRSCSPGVLEFYRDLSEVAGYELETAGVLKGGKKFWALARMGKEPS
jgi:hypothetical protein